MKKRMMMLVALVAALGVQAQKFNIESAIIELQRGSLTEAKDYIDQAAVNESTRDNVKMWLVRGDVYLAITADPVQKDIYANAGVVALESYINCIKKDKEAKRRSFTEADDKMLSAVAPAYNYAIVLFQEGSLLLENEDTKEEGKKRVTMAVETWNVVLTAYEYDVNNQMGTVMNLPKINILQLMADAAIKVGDYERAFKLFNDVIASGKPVPYVYTRPALLHMELGDTAKALEVIEKGKIAFPDDKDLTTLQLMIYQAQGKEELLTDKLTEALESDPGNPTLLANRGNIYDNRARVAVEDLKKELAITYQFRSDIKKEKDAKKKAELQNKMNASIAKTAQLLTKIQHLDSMAIADYKLSLEGDDSQYEVIFNLGAIYFNGALPLVELANNLPSDANYEKEYNKLKAQWTVQYEESLVWFLKAEEMKPDDDSVLMSLQQTYAQLGNETKSMEYKNKRK
ncbi:MAG: tetratricopeptide repeat protein [Bacteroidia bacterium]